MLEQRVFDAILSSDQKAFNKETVKKFISLCGQQIKELRLIGDKFLKKEISEYQFNSMLILFEKLNGSFLRKILKANKSGFGEDQIQELYDEISKLRTKSGLKF